MEALRLDSSNGDIWRELGTARVKRGILDEMDHYYAGAVERKPDPWQGFRAYLYLYFYRDYTRAIADFNAQDSIMGMVGNSQAQDHDAQSFYSYDGSEIRWHKLASNFRGESWLKLETQNFYGLSLDPSGESLWLFDAQNFVAPHRVLQIDLATKSILHDFEAGALPKGLERIW